MALSGKGMPIQFRIPSNNLRLCLQPLEPNVFFVENRIDVSRWKEADLL